MNLLFEQAELADLDNIMDVYQKAVTHMEEMNIFQWDEIYPDREILKEDIQKNQMIKVSVNQKLAAIYVVNSECDEEYDTGAWTTPDMDYVIIHRLCVAPEFQNQGIARLVMQHIESEAVKQRLKSIRLDAYLKNPFSQKLYKKLGFQTVGFADWRKGRFSLMERNLMSTIKENEINRKVLK